MEEALFTLSGFQGGPPKTGKINKQINKYKSKKFTKD